MKRLALADASIGKMNKPKTHIYGLVDPRTNKIRYVGKTVNIKRRLQNHLCPASLNRIRHVAQWLKGLVQHNSRPTVVILETVKESDADKTERRWIRRFKKAGLKLTNLTPGGEGGATYGRLGSKWSPEQYLNYAKTRTGMKVARTAKGNRNRGIGIAKHWAEMRKLGIRKKGPVHTAESKAKIGLSHKGKRLSVDHRAKLRAAKLGKKWTLAQYQSRGRALKESSQLVLRLI